MRTPQSSGIPSAETTASSASSAAGVIVSTKLPPFSVSGTRVRSPFTTSYPSGASGPGPGCHRARGHLVSRWRTMKGDVMKVLVAGATGALGKQLVPMLVARGHEVTGMTRSASKESLVRELGATPAVADALDPHQVARAVAQAEPDVIVHELTALSGSFDMRNFDRFFAMTNRLRTEGTDHLLAAGQAMEVRRFVAQGYAGWPYARTGGWIKTEDDPLDPTPAEHMRETLEAFERLEQA